jgi:GNAT acetyltransferase-like protein
VNCSIGLTERVDAIVTPPLSTRAYEIDPLSDSRWESFISDHPQSSVFHSRHWLQALQIAYGYDPAVLTTSAPETALTNGLVFCRVKSWLTGTRLVSLPFSDHCDPLATNPADLDNLLLYAGQVDVGRRRYLEIRPIPYQPGAQTGLRKSITYRLHSLDLSKSKQELFDAFHKSCVQRKIRRAEREALQYEEGNSEDLLIKFYKLLVATRRRQCIPPQPLSWFRALIQTFGNDLKIRVASKNGSPIASIFTLSHKKSLVYKYGCSDIRFHRLGGMAFLFWTAIKEAKDEGICELDMGRSDVDNLGLISFKEHFGAVGRPLHYWTCPYRPSATRKSQEKAILARIVPITPDFALRTAGRLFYRHVG